MRTWGCLAGGSLFCSEETRAWGSHIDEPWPFSRQDLLRLYSPGRKDGSRTRATRRLPSEPRLKSQVNDRSDNRRVVAG